MFHGSIPAEAQAIMNKVVKMWDVDDIYIGCSGNFTLEKFISPIGRFSLHSNDVTLYSMILGQFFQGKRVELSLSEAGQKLFPWLGPYMESDIDQVATMLLMSRIVAYIGKENHPYYDMMLRENIKQYPTMHEKTAKKLAENKVHIINYYNGDAVEFAKNAPYDVGFISFPPFRKAGKAYVKDFAKLEQIFKFKSPEYNFFDEESLLDYFRLIMQKKRGVLVRICVCLLMSLEIT